MVPLHSIGFRLTAWYSALLMVGLIAIGGVIGYSVNDAMVDSVDGQLQDRVDSLRQFVETSVLDDLDTGTDLDSSSLTELRANLPGTEEDYGELYEDAYEYVSAMPDSDSVEIRSAEGDVLVERLTEVSGQVIGPSPSVGLHPYFETVATDTGLFRILDGEIALAGLPFRIRVATPMTVIVAARRRALSILYWAIPLALIVSSTGGYFISRVALHPLESVVSIASEIDVNRLSRRLQVPATGDVVERLGSTFNSMLSRLEDSVRRLDEFTADASHEMRTPVAIIRTTAELALRQTLSEAELRQSMMEVQQESESLTQLIENLMILARTGGESPLGSFREVDLAQTVEEAVRKFRRTHRERSFSVKVDTRQKSKGDPELLRRLLVVLLDNAAKHTPASSTIRVSLAFGSDEFVLKVADEGPGISPADIHRIFDRFYRVDRSRSRENGSVGLGLSIAKAIVETHGGHISVTSKPGQGTTFTVRLPAPSSEVPLQT